MVNELRLLYSYFTVFFLQQNHNILPEFCSTYGLTYFGLLADDVM